MRLPEYPKDKGSVRDTVTGIIDYLRATTIISATGAVLKQSRRGTTLAVPEQQSIPRTPRQKFVPFWPTLRWTEAGGYTLDMIDGNVILRKSYSSDAVVTILPSDIPDNLTVIDGDKFTCKIEEDEEGLFTIAEIVKTNGAWPVSTAPELVGGDNATGTAGERHIRLCEVLETDSKTSVVIHNVGHIDHFQPTMIQNTINTAYTTGEGGRVLRDFNPVTGVWRAREILAGPGATITETDDTIEITASLDYTIYFADDTTETITEAQIAVGQVDDWGIVCTVSTGAMTGAAVGAGTDRFVGDPQTKYFLPVYIDGDRVSTGGLYQEDTTCIDGEGRQQLIKVG